MTGKRRLRAAGAAVIAGAAFFLAGTADAYRSIGWKGAETFSPVTLGPNLVRCGEFPRNLEARFSGSGIDTEGGAFNVVASGCLDTETFDVNDLRATDTFVASRDQVYIETDDFTMILDESTCVLTNRSPVKFRVAGGSGALTGATGGGRFDMAMIWPQCNGLALPVHVWFSGDLQVPR